MRRTDGKCEDGFGHLYKAERPTAKLCVRKIGTSGHMHVCGKHNYGPFGVTIRPIAECAEER